MKMQAIATVGLVLALMTSTACQVASDQHNVTEITINGSVTVSIKTEGEVTALLLLLSPNGQQKQIQVNTNCKSSEDSEEVATRKEKVVTAFPSRASAFKGRPAKVTLDDIIALRVTGETQIASDVENLLTTTMVSPYPDVKNCLDLQEQGEEESGVYVIRPYDCCPTRSVNVYCDQETDGGGWTVIQRRDQYPEQEEFYRGWQAYLGGFGNLSQEFWLGLNNIHALTNQSNYEIRFDLRDFQGESRWAKYSHFSVGSASSDYRMDVSGYTGTAMDSFTRHNNMPFAAKDHESLNKCASTYKGAWWYSICHDSNLNGQYLNGEHSSYADGVNWRSWKGYYYSLKFTEMKIRQRK